MVDKFSQVAGNIPVTNDDPNRCYTVLIPELQIIPQGRRLSQIPNPCGLQL